MKAKIQCHRCNRSLTEVEAPIHRASCIGYNGYSNYNTWLTALWLDNEEPSYRYWREVADEYREDHDDRIAILQALTERLKEEHEEAALTRLGGTNDVFTDLLRSALDDVDWEEIAENILTE